MKLGPRNLAALASMSAFASIAHAQLIEIEWDAQQQFTRSVDVAPGKFAEVCGKLTPPGSVAWQFEAGEPLNFNVHYHEGKEVRFPAKADAQTRLKGVLDVTTEQDYCWMWSNKGAVPGKLSFVLKKMS